MNLRPSAVRASWLALGLSVVSTGALAQMLPVKPPAATTETELELGRMTKPQDVFQRMQEYHTLKDWRRYTYAVKRLTELRPYSSKLMYELARGYALQADKAGTYDTLIKLQQQGMKYDPSKDPDFDKVRDTPAYEYIVKGLQANANPFGSGKLAFTVDAQQLTAPNEDELIESLAFDAKTSVMYAGSIHSGTVFKVDYKTGKTTPWMVADAEESHYGVFSMTIDSARRRLWLGTASVSLYDGYLPQEDFGRATLVEIDLDTGKRLKAHAIPFDGKPHVPAALALAPNGDVYATDAVVPTIYQLREGKVKALFASPALTGLRGLVVSADNKYVYFSDYETGLYGADLGRNEVFRLTAPKQNLGSIDGLYLSGSMLVAVQNGTNPQRVMRVLLDPRDARVIASVVPLEANKPEFRMPSNGVLVGKDLYFIANSQLSIYGVDGKIIEGQKPVPRQVFVASLDQPLPEAPKPPPQLQRGTPAGAANPPAGQ